ncbi:MAG: hypothetical protein AVDCRST_MAG30-3120, partial [uncultured Solirubrobacteraceae bacterium]
CGGRSSRRWACEPVSPRPKRRSPRPGRPSGAAAPRRAG